MNRAGAALAALSIGAATAAGADKYDYSLMNPTPDALLRELSTDRPDQTESPFTVDAGRVQVETNLFGYSRSRRDRDGELTETYELGTTNVRIGFTHNIEAGFAWQPYGMARTQRRSPLNDVRDSGIGGLELRAKFNLWGNDTFEAVGSTAMGLLPFITLPTDRHNGISPEFVEGGLIVPLAIKLSDKVGLGLNAGVTFARDTDGSRKIEAEYLASAALSYDWSDKLGTYYEIAAAFGANEERVILATGLTYKLSSNVQLDAGINIGVTPDTDRINPFVGVTTRF